MDAYLTAPKLTIYRMMKGPRQREKAKKEAIDQYVHRCSVAEFNELIETCTECTEYDGDNSYEITNGLEIAFRAFSVKEEYFPEAIRYYLKSNTPFDVYPLSILKDLFRIMAPSEVLALIDSEEYENKNAWMFAYYHEIHDEAIDELQLHGLYSFLHSNSDASLSRSFTRNVDFLEKYSKVDDDVLIKASRIILSKVTYSRFVPYLYFSLLFNPHRNSPESVVKKFESDLELLEDIYIESIDHSQYVDYDGSFLKEIYQASPTILEKYINRILCTTKSPNFDEYKEKSMTFFDVENADQVFDTIVDSLIASAKYAVYDVSDFIESIVTPEQEKDRLTQKQDQWIRHFITKNSNDSDKMKYLFYGIDNLATERKVDYIKLLLENNPSYEVFESLPLFPLTTSWTNSAVSYLTSRIKYMEQILPCLSGLKFIRHKKRIENIIDALREKIRQEEISDILES